MSLMLIVKVTVFVSIIFGIIIFVLKKVLFDSTQGAVNRLHRETEDVRAKQAELNEKIKQANEELVKRRSEADALVSRMTQDAEAKAREEREKIIKKARQDGDEIIAKAQKSKDDMRKAIEKEVDMKAVDFTTILLAEVLSEKSITAFDESLIGDFFESLEEVDMSVIDQAVTTAELVTATALTEKFRNRLSDLLQKKLNRIITIQSGVDKNIIVGALLRFGGLSLDGSLQNMLKDKAMLLKEKIERGLLKKT